MCVYLCRFSQRFPILVSWGFHNIKNETYRKPYFRAKVSTNYFKTPLERLSETEIPKLKEFSTYN